MKKIVYFVMSIFVLSLTVLVNAQDAQNKGSETVIFEKGKMPKVIFAHHMHQQRLNNDCSSCHDLFPMQAGIVKEMIVQKKLKKQQVMNSKCIKCHKEKKAAGLNAGPVKCTQCHVRPK